MLTVHWLSRENKSLPVSFESRVKPKINHSFSLLEMEQFMQKLKSKVTVGIVGGSDYSKITEQLGKF